MSERLVRPKVELESLLVEAGADKNIFTVQEILFYLGKYIMSKKLYDKQQQHIVHCGEDALGPVLGVKSFSVKEPRALFAMISRNLVAVKNPETQSSFSEPRSQSEPDRGPGDTDSESQSSTSQQQRRRRRSSDPEASSPEDETRERRKRQKSDNSISLMFDDSLSCCVIRGNSESSESHSNTDVGVSHSDDRADSDSDSDNFSVEFEVESIESDDYSEKDEDSEPGDHEDYWKCAKCDELNPPLPSHCKSCWKVQPDSSLADGSMTDSHPTSSQPSTSSGGCSLPSTFLELCVICQSRPKNGCIVHGRTGHLMACYTCAKTLKKRNKPCPVCRELIQSVVLTFVS